RRRKSPAATAKVGAKGTVRSRRLEGRCVKTIVRTRPIREAIHAAAKCEAVFAIRAPKKSRPMIASETPNRSKKKNERSAVVRNPPARLSSPKSAESFQSAERVPRDGAAGRGAAGRSAAGERNR